MALRLFRFFVVALSLSFVGVDLARAAGADALAPCERLSAHARGLPDSAWVKGFRALKPQLTLADRNAKPSRLEARVAGMASVKAALSDEEGGYPVHVEQLAPNLFVASVTEGTLECETFAFLKTGPGGRATIVPGPPAFSDQCWTDSGQAGRVLGQPAFVETSDFTDPAADEQHLEITPRTGDGWGPSCRLTLNYRISFAVSERFCGDRGVCAAATPFAASIAAAHGKARSDAPFTYGPPPSKAAMELMAAARGAIPGELPTFGAKAKTAFVGFSNEGLDVFPLQLKGVTYVAAVGYGGVGWREIGDTLLAIYRAKGDLLTPLAGFVVVKSVKDLASAKVDRPKPSEDR